MKKLLLSALLLTGVLATAQETKKPATTATPAQTTTTTTEVKKDATPATATSSTTTTTQAQPAATTATKVEATTKEDKTVAKKAEPAKTN